MPVRRATVSTDESQGWYTLGGALWGGRRTRAGVRVDEDSALTFAGVWRASRILSEAESGLPLLTYKRRDDDGREPATELPVYDLLKSMPNPDMESVSFRCGRTLHQVNWGNGFAEVERTGRTNDPLWLWPIHPSRVRPTMPHDKLDAELFPYIVRNNDGTELGMKRDEMLHIPGAFPEDGVWGKGTIAYMRELVGYAQSVQRHGAGYFGSGAMPKGVLTLPGMKDPEARRQYRKEWKEVHGSPDANEIAILPVDAKFNPIMISNEDSQFLECCVPETLVTLSDGTQKRCDALTINDVVLGWDAERKCLVPSRLAAIADNGVHPLIKITTHRGRSLVTTCNHPYLGSKRQRCAKCSRRHGPSQHGLECEWIRADALSVGDYVRTGLRFRNDEPVHISAEEAWSVGALIGDGGTTGRGSVKFTTKSAGILSKMNAFAGSIGGEIRQTVVSSIDWYFAGRDQGRAYKPNVLRHFLKPYDVLGKKAHEKTVPDRIAKSGPESRAAFLAGLWDTDGTISKPESKQPRIVLASTSRQLIEGAMHLLASLGIQSAIYDHTPAGVKTICGQECNVRQGYQLAVCGKSEAKRFAEVIGPHMAEESKRERVAHFAAADLGASEHGDFFEYDRIVKIEELTPGRTIALTVEGTHSHVTNGLITHNTSKLTMVQIATAYGLPPYMLGEYDKAAARASVEAQGIEFVVYSLMPWLRSWEARCNLTLLTKAQRVQYFIEHLLAGLLRGDFKSRMDGYRIALAIGLMTVNEARRLENMTSIGSAGDFHAVQSNMTTWEAMEKNGGQPPGPQNQVPFDALANDPKVDALPEPDAVAEGSFDAWTKRTAFQLASGKTPRPQGRTIAVRVSADPQPVPAPTQPALIDLPDVRQEGDFDCGPACVRSCAEYFGVGGGRSEADYIRELGTTQADGTEPEAMVDWFNDIGKLICVVGPGMTIDDLAEFTANDRPVVCPIQNPTATDSDAAANKAGHYVCVIGVGMGLVFYQDPLAGRQMLAAEVFDQRWHDLEADGIVNDHYGIAVGRGVPDIEDEAEVEEPAETPAPVALALPPPVEVVAPAPAALPAPASPAMLAAARSNLADAVRRLAVKEANAAQRAAKGDGWDEWCAAFWLKHRELAASALRPACEMLAALGVTCDQAELAARACEAGDRILRMAYDTDTPEQFTARLAGWPDARAADALAMIPEESAGVTSQTNDDDTVTFTVRAQSSPVMLTMPPQPPAQINVQPPVVNVESPVVNVPAPVVTVQPAQQRPFKIVPVRDEKTNLVKHYECIPEGPPDGEKPAAE